MFMSSSSSDRAFFLGSPSTSESSLITALFRFLPISTSLSSSEASFLGPSSPSPVLAPASLPMGVLDLDLERGEADFLLPAGDSLCLATGDRLPLRDLLRLLLPPCDPTGDLLAVRDLTGDLLGVRDLGGDLLPVRDRTGDLLPLRDLTGDLLGVRDLGGDLLPVLDRAGDLLPLRDLTGDLLGVLDLGGDPLPDLERTGDLLTERDPTGERLWWRPGEPSMAGERLTSRLRGSVGVTLRAW